MLVVSCHQWSSNFFSYRRIGCGGVTFPAGCVCVTKVFPWGGKNSFCSLFWFKVLCMDKVAVDLNLRETQRAHAEPSVETKSTENRYSCCSPSDVTFHSSWMDRSRFRSIRAANFQQATFSASADSVTSQLPSRINVAEALTVWISHMVPKQVCPTWMFHSV